MKKTLKECTKCGISKNIDQFYNKMVRCKDCHKKIISSNYDQEKLDKSNQYYQNNKEKIQARRKELKDSRLDLKLKHMVRNSKQRALICGMEFDINWLDLQELWDKQKGKCALSKRNLELTGERMSNKVSLDRINSKRGYTKDNIQLVTSQVNYMKVEMSYEELISLCKDILGE